MPYPLSNYRASGKPGAVQSAEICKTFEELGWAEKCMEKGIEKGELKGKLEDARAMFAEGMDVDVIARITKVPLNTLKKELSIQ
jgi:predicted transposase/invertase (TIGR01784 family)